MLILNKLALTQGKFRWRSLFYISGDFAGMLGQIGIPDVSNLF